MKAIEVKKLVDSLLEQGVTTREAYEQAVPLIFELRKAIKGTKDWFQLLNARCAELSDAAAAYAIDHKSALDEPLSTDRDGVENGSVEIGGRRYRLTLSLAEPVRISGGNLTQQFLCGLPKGMTANKLTLKASALAGMSPDDMARYDLKRDVKRVWSIPEAA